jgi:hypothetical protein
MDINLHRICRRRERMPVQMRGYITGIIQLAKSDANEEKTTEIDWGQPVGEEIWFY